MAVYKCKMCGDDLPVVEGKTVVECESCGTVQTIPTAKEEGIQKTFNRANTLRMKSEFDKAEQLYEKIIQADETQSEAYWGLLLCKYGIEYVEDPKTLERKPTCHRASYDSIVADDDYKSALQYADAVQREIYEKQAAEIDRIQKEILELSRKEEPYDVFICYKETDEEGKRTEDSVIANDIYYELTNAGFKVFYAAITLEDKLGSAYEPCIFAALHSAKVMLSIGTKPEYFNAVWVKNEWSRYLALMKKDRSKLLIPCYRDMDAYDLPDEFAHLQAQDMSKIGFINDIVRGIKKVIAKEEQPKAEKETATESAPISNNAKALLKRGQLALDDGEWQAATGFFDEVLNQNAECAEAYLGQKLAQEHLQSLDAFVEKRKENLQNLPCEKVEAVAENTDLIADSIAKFNKYNIIYKSEIQQAYEFDRQYDSCVSSCQKILDDENTYWREDKYLSKVLRFANGAFAEKISTKRKEIMDAIVSRMENEKKNDAVNIKDITDGYRTQCDKATATLQEKFDKRLEEKYQDYCLQEEKANTASAFQKVSDLFGGIIGYRDAEEHMKQCQTASKDCKIKEKKDKIRKKKIIISVVCVVLIFTVTTVLLIQNLFIPMSHYHKGEILLANESYSEAVIEFAKADNYSDAKQKITDLWKQIAHHEAISAGIDYTVGLCSDGTVVATKYTGEYYYGQCEVSSWKDIVAISAGFNHTVGLRADGTVVATKYTGNQRFYEGQCDVSSWTDIVAIADGGHHTVGLCADGTVVATGDNGYGQCNMSSWKDVVAVAGGSSHTVGLRSDGTVVATGRNYEGQCDVADWKDIIAISAGDYHTVGLRSDGTVVVTGRNYNNECDVSSWKDIIAISAEGSHTVGLRADGTVVATGSNDYGQCGVSSWTNIVAISAGEHHTVGLRSDGTVVATGDNDYGQCNVSSWTNIGLPELK